MSKHTPGPSFNAAIEWIALNDATEAGNAEWPLVSESLIADLFGTTTDHVCFCVARFRAYEEAGKTPPRMKIKRARAALEKVGCNHERV